jgi:adenosylmethionine-8-amino-7-oxononanoate aminotransferase
VANASLALLDPSPGGAPAQPGDQVREGWQAAVQRIEAGLRAGLARAWDVPGVRDVRVQGAIGVVQLDHDVDITTATRAAVAQGVWLRPFRDLVYAMPPYVTAETDVTLITNGLVAAAAAG